MTTTMGNPGGGFDPVTHQSRATVVKQTRDGGQPATMMAFGYQYDVVGKLQGIADWRGRSIGQTSSLGLNIPHPAQLDGSYSGYHQPGFPSGFDAGMTPPAELSSGGTITGWPVGMTPSDAVFEYDTLNQLRGEEREYITGSGDDIVVDEDGNLGQRRVRAATWEFDSQGSMTEWIEGGTNPAASANLGRALGNITNGHQLNASYPAIPSARTGTPITMRPRRLTAIARMRCTLPRTWTKLGRAEGHVSGSLTTMAAVWSSK
jgi:hypothetical protein